MTLLKHYDVIAKTTDQKNNCYDSFILNLHISRYKLLILQKSINCFECVTTFIELLFCRKKKVEKQCSASSYYTYRYCVRFWTFVSPRPNDE